MADQTKTAHHTGAAATQTAAKPAASTTANTATAVDEKEIERPKRLKDESDESYKARLIAEYHKPMLKKLSAVRVPRVVAAIKSVGGLVTHKPNEAQQKFIIAQLRAAVDEAEKELKGELETVSTFSIPD